MGMAINSRVNIWKMGNIWSQCRALMPLWPLNCDLCISNPLIMFIPSPNPSVPHSCPSVQVSVASDLPVHHEVAFVQLWPHLLGRATLTQPFRRQDGPLLRSPWQPWLPTPRLLTSTPSLPWLSPSQTPIPASPVWIWIWGQLWTTNWASTSAKSPCGRQTKNSRLIWDC